MIPRCVSFLPILSLFMGAASLAAQDYQYAGVGTLGDGAAAVGGQLLGNLRPDLMLLALDDGTSANPQDYVRYRILRDLDSNGAPAFIIPTGTNWLSMPITTGNDAEGLGAAVTEINGNSLPDVLVVVYDAGTSANPANTFRWFVAKDLGSSGSFASFTAPQSPPAAYMSVGQRADGAGCAIGQIDNNPLPDVVFMAYDDPAGANQFRYVVGFNLNSNGTPSSWGGPYFVQGVGSEGDGADACIAQLDSDPRPDLVFSAYDDPAGTNSHRTRVGWNLDTAGQVLQWSSLPDVPVALNGAGVSGRPEGAGMAIVDLGGDARPDLAFVAYDTNGSTSAANFFHVHWQRNWLGTSASFGTGCVLGATQVPHLRVAQASLPTAGQQLTLQLDNAIGWMSATVLVDIGGPMQPISLGPLGLPGCTLYALQIPLAMSGMPLFPQRSISLPVGSSGWDLHAQAYAIGGSPGLGFSQRCDIVVGQ